MSALGKNVRKIAEVSFSRLAVALPSKLTSEELSDYSKLVAKLCSKAQGLAEWHIYVDRLLHPGPSLPPALSPMAQLKAEVLLNSLRQIAACMKEIVCEMLLRDIEYLLDKYLVYSRKCFSRMHWDEESSSANAVEL